MDSTAKSLEQQLAEALRENAALRESLDKAQEECARSLEAAQTANEELQRFSYAASHDLKEPLRSISTQAELLQRHYAGDEKALEFTSFIVEGVRRMNTLIETLLTYSKTGAPAKRT